MLSIDTVPTRLLSQSSRLAMADGQRQLAAAQKEATTGRRSDPGLALGSATASDLSLRMELGGIESAIGLGALAKVRAAMTQSALSSVTELARHFHSALSGARGAENGARLAADAAASALSGLHDLLSASHDGQYLFGGLNSDAIPLQTYADNPRAAAIMAFTAEFGFPPSDPAANGLTASQISAFIDGGFQSLFTNAGWASTWSAAASENPVFRLDAGQSFDLSSNTNQPFVKALAQAFTMIEVLGEGAINAQAFQLATDRSMVLVLEAQAQIGAEQARIGIGEQRLKTALDALEARKSRLSSVLESLEGVDPYEAAARVNLLMTQLETSYALTGRISRLSLLSYI